MNRPAPASPSADSHRSILIVGIPTPTGTACPSLPHVPHLHRASNRCPPSKPRQHIGSIANQRRALDRSRDLSVFDEIRFRRRENKLAVRDVDLPPPKFTAYTPFFTERIMSPGSSCPPAYKCSSCAASECVRSSRAPLPVSARPSASTKVCRSNIPSEFRSRSARFLASAAFIVHIQRPAAPRIVPLSTTVHFSLATRLPISRQTPTSFCD